MSIYLVSFCIIIFSFFIKIKKEYTGCWSRFNLFLATIVDEYEFCGIELSFAFVLLLFFFLVSWHSSFYFSLRVGIAFLADAWHLARFLHIHSNNYHIHLSV